MAKLYFCYVIFPIQSKTIWVPNPNHHEDGYKNPTSNESLLHTAQPKSNHMKDTEILKSMFKMKILRSEFYN